MISQRLLPAEGGGRVAAYEVLMANDAVRNLVREGKTRQLRNAMISGQQEGMQTIEMDLARLVSQRHHQLRDRRRGRARTRRRS